MRSVFKYSLLRLMRNKANLFWILIFPIVLGCLFKVAFSNITESESFHTIPVALVSDESINAKAFCTMADALSSEDDNAMLAVTYCNDKKAQKLLKEKKVDGIFLCKRYGNTPCQRRCFGFFHQSEYFTGFTDTVLCQPGSIVKNHAGTSPKFRGSDRFFI